MGGGQHVTPCRQQSASAVTGGFCWDEDELQEQLQRPKPSSKLRLSKACRNTVHGVVEERLSPVPIFSQNVLKESWEEYCADDLVTLATHARRRGEELIRLSDGQERWVHTEWFDAVVDSPLHHMLFDERWGQAGSLDTNSEVFDDICTFLHAASTANCAGSCLPEAKLRLRRRNLLAAADFYGLQALSEALAEAETQEAAAREKAAREAKAAKEAAAAARRRNQRRIRRQQCWRGTEERAFNMTEQLESFSMRCTTKALDLSSVVNSVQRACQNGGGPKQGYNKQSFYTARSAPKGQRF
ncbi:unnamed protein product [Polarella glacialis]|uniref:Uncharacterized protein n=1 Tax=Polarella glacialis TaxID=89957 RepID=A0A813DXS6_POLGL|nr:unnamed protein product [Polarella glacialis]CAE8712128.1 unnamed protein product [Polarella glacialis]